MIQFDLINAKAAGIVGWDQPTSLGSPVISTANKTSSSGLYYIDGNALCTIDNIKNTVDDDQISDSDLNAKLTRFSQGAMAKVCSTIFDQEDHVETDLLYKYINKFSETLPNVVDFVGFEIDLWKRNDFSLVINSLILEFDSAAPITVILFNSQVNAPIKTQVVTTVANTDTSQDVNWVLNDLQYGGKWYIGYLRGSLTAKAIKRNFQMSRYMTIMPEMGVIPEPNYLAQFPSMGVRPVQIPGWDAQTMFDPSTVRYVYDNWGLNFNFSIHKDFTWIVLSNLRRFASALQLQVCVNVIDQISNSTRSNKTERLSKAYALLELDGNRNNPNLPYHVGLHSKLAREIEKLKETYNPKGIMRMTL